MRPALSKPLLIGVGVASLLLIAIGAGILLVQNRDSVPAEESAIPQEAEGATRVIGRSVEGRAIEVMTYGTGENHLLFVGGMHGGYEWNSVLLAYQFMDYLEAHPEIIPASLSIDIIPSINPDGVYKVTGKEGRFLASEVSTDSAILAAARFNAHAVDLNRNFDCHWQPESSWQGRTVDAGTAAFSEPEAKALRDLVMDTSPIAAVFWHSQANAVYASECDEGVLPTTRTLMNTYATAARYTAVPSFTAYPITGDAEGWLASLHIPAITVELATHGDTEWERNLVAMKALLALYGKR